jgi:hypothetical protein
VTSVDYRVLDDGPIMCIECKWAEAGIGACSCARAGGDPETGKCRPAVLNDRPLYWDTANDVFFLADLRRLVLAIRATLGIEALIWLTDIGGLSRDEAADLMRHSARSLLRSALAAGGITDHSA